MVGKRQTRREFLRVLGAGAGGAIGVVVLAGCGEAKPAAKATAAAKATTAAPAATKAAEKIGTTAAAAAPQAKAASIGFWMQQWDDGVNAMKGAIASYQAKYPNFKVELTPIGYSDLLAKFYPAITTQTSGEVVYTYTDWWFPIDVTKVLRPLTPELKSKAEMKDIFFPAALSAVASKDGEYYVVPLICGQGGSIFLVDVKEAEAAGIDVSKVAKSWQDFDEAAKKGTKKEGDRMVRGGLAVAWGTMGQWVQAMTQQLGAQYYDVEKETFNWDKPEVEAGIKLTTELGRNYSTRELLTTGAGTPLPKKTHVLEAGGLWKVSSYGNSVPDLVVVPNAVPAFPGSKKLVYEVDPVGSLSIPKFVKDEKLEAAYRFVEHVWQPDSLAKFGDFYSGSHAVQAVYKNDYYIKSKWGKYGVELMPGKVWPYVSYPPHHVAQLYSELASPLEKVAYDNMAVKDMISEVQTKTAQKNKEALDRFKAG